MLSLRVLRPLTAIVVVATMSLPAGAVDPSLDDGAVIAIYNQVNTFDIEIAGLALRRGHDPRVVALAEMVQKDHTAVRQSAADLAGRLGLARSLPGNRAAAQTRHAKTLTRLAALSGANFDRAYLEHEVAFHTTAIVAVKETLLPAVRNAELRSLIQAVLPGFEQHLQATRSLLEALSRQ